MAARQYVALALQLNLFPGLAVLRDGEKRERQTTLSGGSLGSCVDEERSQLRELM